MSHPLYPEDVIHNTPVVYYRFHGVPDLYKSPYSITKLKQIAKEIKSSAKTKETFLYFNNDIDAEAIHNAMDMKKIIGR